MKKQAVILLVVLAAALVSCGSMTNATSSQTTTGKAAAVAEKTSNVLTKIDNLLDMYDQYVGKYIAAYKAFRSDDPLTKLSAATEAAQLLKDANNIGTQLEGLKNQMSNSQVSRWTNLASQLATAVKDFQAESGK